MGTKLRRPELSVVVPTYNERDSLPKLLERISKALEGKLEFEVVVVDDDSPDGTWKLAEELARTRYPWLRVVRRVGERGLATAVLRGILEARGRYVVVMDADLQHPPELIPKLYAEAVGRNADLVVASRYAKGGGVEGWSAVRRLVSRVATVLAYLLLPEARATTDPLSGFFLVRRDLVVSRIGELQPKGYKILLEMLVKLRPGVVVDVPYVFGRRVAGKSKLGIKVIMDYLLHLINLNDYRIVKNACVGATGLAVLWGFLYLLSDLLGLNVMLSYALALEASIVNNYLLNTLFVFKGRTTSPLRGLAKYHAAVAVGALTNFAVFTLLHVILGLAKYVSSFLGVLVGFLANYALSEHFVWSPKPSPRGGPEEKYPLRLLGTAWEGQWTP